MCIYSTSIGGAGCDIFLAVPLDSSLWKVNCAASLLKRPHPLARHSKALREVE
jgi:hypothetical protein